MRGDPMRRTGTSEVDAFDWDIVDFIGGPIVVCASTSAGPETATRLSSIIEHVNGEHVSSRAMLQRVRDGDRLTTRSGNTYVLRGVRKDRARLVGTTSVFSTEEVKRVSWPRRFAAWLLGQKPDAASIARP